MTQDKLANFFIIFWAVIFGIVKIIFALATIALVAYLVMAYPLQLFMGFIVLYILGSYINYTEN